MALICQNIQMVSSAAFIFHLQTPHKYAMNPSITELHPKGRARVSAEFYSWELKTMRDENGIFINPAADVKAFVMLREIETNGGLICYHIDNRFAVRESEGKVRRKENFFCFSVIQNFLTRLD